MSAMKQLIGYFVFGAALFLPCMGCGSGTDLGQVSGVVLYDGKPVPNLSIEFIPIDGRPSLARTNEEGRFEAYYLPQQPGAAPGTHRLESEFAKSGPNDKGFERPRRRGEEPKPLVLDPKEIEVVAGETLDLTLELVEQE
jgi:hypothetical protein